MSSASQTRAIDRDAGPFGPGLREALDRAAPVPVPWAHAADLYDSGDVLLIKGARAAALISHSGMFGHLATSIVAMTGELDGVGEVVDRVEAEARKAGASLVVWIGRRGWVRAFSDYQELAVIGGKEL